MEDDVVTASDVLEQWRDATRAAELAERLADLANESAARSDDASRAAHEIADMANRAAVAAGRASEVARKAADQARRDDDRVA
jgi:methyl-accepting chemotaxis protein